MDKIEINVDVITGEITQTISQFTAQEIANSQAIDAAKAQEEQAQATTKASALAKLTALGLTQDEIKALVG
jgi:hypothetical protein